MVYTAKAAGCLGYEGTCAVSNSDFQPEGISALNRSKVCYKLSTAVTGKGHGDGFLGLLQGDFARINGLVGYIVSFAGIAIEVNGQVIDFIPGENMVGVGGTHYGYFQIFSCLCLHRAQQQSKAHSCCQASEDLFEFE